MRLITLVKQGMIIDLRCYTPFLLIINRQVIIGNPIVWLQQFLFKAILTLPATGTSRSFGLVSTKIYLEIIIKNLNNVIIVFCLLTCNFKCGIFQVFPVEKLILSFFFFEDKQITNLSGWC